MSLVWPATETDIVLSGPRLHAFVVAVGDYPHLMGGTGPLAHDPFGLSQIATPRFTGPSIAAWLINELKNGDRPLGSVEVLLSPGGLIDTPAGPVNANPATMANIEQSFAAWFKRCNSRTDNAAFFYFCGHGLAKIDQYLLPEDFGDPSAADIWKKCIDFDGLQSGMRRKCRAQTQLFFVDACRETPFGILAQMNVRGEPLISATFNDPVVPCSAAYYATTEGRQAYGPDNCPTYFSQALLRCLNGVAAIKRKSGKWMVDTYSLGNALGQTMAQYARRFNLPLSCNPDPGGMATIHEASAPRVIVAIECSLAEASDVADIRISNELIVLHSPPGSIKPIVEDVAAGRWTVAVSFPGGQFTTPAPEEFVFMPPVFEGVEVP
ncbi:caspase family protein [Bradyrhizobium liaoningense]|uniref:caspase family protein n=1 Tax=Bradyrhizobium liaoningense TaxID=43992 RepID=UPI001BA623BE|nr:caspase family protein [Bradyrhizobium liaoningense]MBR1068857.1 caspase family protein [Bradyrhizobium liaoningense]